MDTMKIEEKILKMSAKELKEIFSKAPFYNEESNINKVFVDGELDEDFEQELINQVIGLSAMTVDGLAEELKMNIQYGCSTKSLMADVMSFKDTKDETDDTEKIKTYIKYAYVTVYENTFMF